MMRDYYKRLDNLKQRRQDVLTKAFSVSESFKRNQYGEAITYTLEAMEPIDANYTRNTYEACEKIQGHLKKGLLEYQIEVSFRYQGSVPTNTHIKLYSDVDLLTIHEGFVTLEPPQTPTYPYQGNPVADLKDMRSKVYRILDSVYSAAKIDDSGSKALTISGGSLNRTIDLISCNWYDSVKYSETNDADYRGVNVLDRDNDRRILNYPFMHIYWINTKDAEVNGNVKRLIRLLKTLRSDADEEIKVSSYDIASLVFRMDTSLLMASKLKRLDLLDNCNLFLKRVISDSAYRDSLNVANSTRKIFCGDGAKLPEVVKLQKELNELIQDINLSVKPLYEALNKAEVIY
ncbi:MAG: hypothetical protein DYG99_16805 [Bacteroidetes bacterium CHB5]|nr:hypothetical protein [Bacteroidetes bacterium CHB5]